MENKERNNWKKQTREKKIPTDQIEIKNGRNAFWFIYYCKTKNEKTNEHMKFIIVEKSENY